VLLTATPDELAVREAIDTARRLRQLGIVRIRALLNCTVDALFAPAELAAIRGLDGHRRLALRRRELGRRSEEARRRLAAAKLDPIEIPMLFRAELSEREFAGLARRLGEALLADEVRA